MFYENQTLMNCLHVTEYVYWKLPFSDFKFAISGCPCNSLWRIINSAFYRTSFVSSHVLERANSSPPNLKIRFCIFGLHWITYCTFEMSEKLLWDKPVVFLHPKSFIFCFTSMCICVHTHTFRYIHVCVKQLLIVRHCLKVTCFSSRILLDFSVNIYSFATPDKLLFFWL